MPGPLLVVTVDRLPAWIMPAYGTTWVAMPACDRLAARGLVFDALIARSADPRETIRGLLGRLTDDAGMTSAVVTDDAAMVEGVMPGDATVVPVAPPRQADREEATNLGRLFAAASAAAGRRPDVLWCHAGSLGASWDAPDDLREAYLDPDEPPPPSTSSVPDLVVTAATDPDIVTGLRHVFAAQLTLFDRCLGRLVEVAGDGRTILVAGVRGLPLGLHGRLGPGPVPPFGELVRLPAILVDPTGRMAGQRFGGLAVPEDLGATLAAAPGDGSRPSPHPWEGRDLGGLFDSWTAEGRDRVITVTAEGVAVTTPGWRLVVPAGSGAEAGQPMLFARPDDHFERCDVANRSVAIGEELAAIAAAAARGEPAAWTTPLSPAAVSSG